MEESVYETDHTRLARGTGVLECPGRVLLVDDDAELRRFAAKSLRDAGYVVSEAVDGAAALDAVGRERPDLIIADLHMPQLDGQELLRALKSDHATAAIPFVLLSGDTNVLTRVACLDAGASDVLAKPIDGAELAARARMQLQTVRSMRRLRAQSEIDELTKVLNRRGLMRALEREQQLAIRRGQPLSLLLVDADDFKSINDRFGHQVGDEVLREIASTLGRCVRSCDTVARLGGDEFVVLLPAVEEGAAEEIEARIRSHISRVRVGDSSRRLTLSIGRVCTGTSETLENSVSVERLLDAADGKMYRDKQRSQSRREREIAGLRAL